MLNIKGLSFCNFRIFSDKKSLKLAPVTILTGANNSGKSTITGSFSLMKNLDTSVFPFNLRLDSVMNNYGSFEMITNKKNVGQFHIGYDLYNIILGETLRLEFTFEKDGNFDAVIRNFQVRNNSGILFGYNIEKHKVISRIDSKYFLGKLKQIKSEKKIFLDVERALKEIRMKSGSYSSGKENGFGGNIPIFRIDNNLKKKNILTYLNEQGLTGEECDRLFYLYSKQNASASDELSQRIRKIVEGFEPNDILFNNSLLKRILSIPKNELNVNSFKEILKKEFPDLYDCLVMLKSDSASEVIDLLNFKCYDQWETEFLEKEVFSSRRLSGTKSSKDISGTVIHHIQTMYEASSFFRTLTELSATREGFAEAYSRYNNLRTLASFTSLVLEKMLSDLKNDVCNSVIIPGNNTGRSSFVSFDNPLHDQLRHYSTSGNNTFLKKWLIEFGLGDDLDAGSPVNGMGYFPVLRKNSENLFLGNEGEGLNNLFNILLGVTNARLCTGLKNYNDEIANYPRTIILNSPENGLHPSWQIKLADFILDAVQKLGVHFIIETHSPYLIDKLKLLIRTEKMDSSSLLVYKLENSEGSVRINELGPDDYSDFIFGNYDSEAGKNISAIESLKLRKINLN
jgi:AAA15 family ATPase/GTPase